MSYRVVLMELCQVAFPLLLWQIPVNQQRGTRHRHGFPALEIMSPKWVLLR